MPAPKPEITRQINENPIAAELSGQADPGKTILRCTPTNSGTHQNLHYVSMVAQKGQTQSC